MTNRALTFRADASAQIGIGHVVRSLALAEAWMETGGVANFVSRALPTALKKRLSDAGVRLEEVDRSEADAERTCEVACAWGSEWIVLDGYFFTAQYVEDIRRKGLRVLLVEDFTSETSLASDGILNGNVYATLAEYSKIPATTLRFIGSSFTLLRSQFLQWKNWQREIPPQAQKLWISLGGGDPGALRQQIHDALKDPAFAHLEVRYAAGPADSQHSSFPNPLWKVDRDVWDVAAAMAWADVAISAAGSTVWEMAFMGLPSLILSRAPNQIRIAKEAHLRGFGWNLGEASHFDSKQFIDDLRRILGSRKERSEMSRNGRKLIDGMGARRTCEGLFTGARLKSA